MSSSAGKGVGLAEMTQLGVPVPAGLHDHDRRLPRVPIERQGAAGRARRRDRPPPRGAGAEDGQAFRRHERPAARLGPLGRCGLDAGDDGHDPEPRAQRRGGGGPRGRDRQRAVRERFLPAPDSDVRRGGRRNRGAPLRAGADRSQEVARRLPGRRSRRRGSRRADRDVQADLRGGDRSKAFRRIRATS